VHGIGNAQLGEPACRSPAAVLPLERALVYEHLQHLLEEEGIALGARQKRPAHVVRHARLAEEV